MRVGVYLGDFAPEEGGAHGFVASVLDGLLAVARSSAHRFVALCEPGQARALGERFAAAGLEHDELGARRLLGDGIAALRHYSPLAYLLNRWPARLDRAAKRNGIDVIWFVPGLAYEALDTPYIGTIWDLQHRINPWFPEVGGGGLWEHRELIYSRFVQRAAQVLVRSRTVAAQLHELYGVPLARIRVLGQPVTLSDPGVAPTPAVAHLAGERFFFYPAQFWPHKNHVNLLAALARVDGVRLVLTGADKGNLAHVRRTAEHLGLADRLVFPGFIPASDVAWLYRHALGLVYPSFNGPDNLPPLEAFALGCPVALADLPGIDEMAGDAALRFDPRDAGSIAQALRRLAGDAALREELARKGRGRAEGKTGADYARAVLGVLDAFESVRRCWG